MVGSLPGALKALCSSSGVLCCLHLCEAATLTSRSWKKTGEVGSVQYLLNWKGHREVGGHGPGAPAPSGILFLEWKRCVRRHDVVQVVMLTIMKRRRLFMLNIRPASSFLCCVFRLEVETAQEVSCTGGREGAMITEKFLAESREAASHVQLACSALYCAFPLDGSQLCLWSIRDPSHQVVNQGQVFFLRPRSPSLPSTPHQHFFDAAWATLPSVHSAAID